MDLAGWLNWTQPDLVGLRESYSNMRFGRSHPTLLERVRLWVVTHFSHNIPETWFTPES